jgi:hypothetical protein
MSSNDSPLKSGAIEPQIGSYEEFLARKRGCLVAVDAVLKRIPESRSATRDELVKIFRVEYPGARWGVETICRSARTIQNTWGQYRADALTQSIRDSEEQNYRRLAAETASLSNESFLANSPSDEAEEKEASTAWTAITAQFEKYRHALGDKEALTKITANVEAYATRFDDADVLTQALQEAADVNREAGMQ